MSLLRLSGQQEPEFMRRSGGVRGHGEARRHDSADRAAQRGEIEPSAAFSSPHHFASSSSAVVRERLRTLHCWLHCMSRMLWIP